MGYLDDNKYAGCLMFASPGRVIQDCNGIVSYDANTFPGQSGGNGVEEIVLSHQGGQDNRVMLDFLHTLGGRNPHEGNKGVKIEGIVSDQILNWVKETRSNIDKQIIEKQKESHKMRISFFEKERMVCEMWLDKVSVERIQKYTNLDKDDITKIVSALNPKK